jgi:predicted Na+-dependent transporter
VNVEKIARAVVQLLKIVTVPVEVGQVVREIDGMSKAHELAIALEDSLLRGRVGQR